MGFATTLRNNFIDNVALASDVYVALFTAAPDDDGAGGTEVSGGSYARVQFNDWVAAVNGQSSNNTVITFPQATAGWGTVVAFGLYDALSGGNFRGWNTLDTSRTINNTDIPRFSAGELDVQFNTP